MQPIRDVDVTGQEIVVVHHRIREILVSRKMARKMVKMENKAMEKMERMIISQDNDVLDVDLAVVAVVVDIEEVVDLTMDIDVVYQNVMAHLKETGQQANLKENVQDMSVMAVEMDVLVTHVVGVEHLDVEEVLEEVDDQAVHVAAICKMVKCTKEAMQAHNKIVAEDVSDVLHAVQETVQAISKKEEKRMMVVNQSKIQQLKALHKLRQFFG
jgi:hypothetical protein